jgi:hypothetical protein
MKKLVAEILEESYHEDFQRDYEDLLDKAAVKSNRTKDREFDEFENDLLNNIEDIEAKHFQEMDQEIFEYVEKLSKEQNDPEIIKYLEAFLDELQYNSRFSFGPRHW